MAVLTATTVSRAGLDLAGAAADVAGDEFANTGKEYLVVTNDSGGSINVTLDIRATIDGAAATDPAVAVGAGVTKIIGPFPKAIYDDTDEHVNVTYSAVTSVTVKVVKLPNL